MTETKVSSPAPKKRRVLRILAGIIVLVLVLLVVAFFVGTSAGFLKSVILPRVGKSMNAEITVSDAAIHPFSAVTLRDLKVTPNGRETLLTAPEVRARYSLMDIIRGNLKVEEVSITSPTIHLVENPDGTSNLDPLLKSPEKEKAGAPAPKPGAAKKAGQPPQIDLSRLALSNATLRKEKLYAGGTRDIMEISNLNVTLTNFKNGESGKLTLSANASVHNNPPAPGTNGVLEATMNGEYVFAFSPELKPLSVKGQTLVAVSRAEGAFSDLDSASVNLAAEVSPTDITQIALRLQKGSETLGEVRVSGPFNMEKSEGSLKVELLSLDKRALNLIGAKSGIDFGTTAINSTNQIQIANAGSAITITGRFDASKVQMIRTNQTTPTLDLGANYDLSVDKATSNAVLRTFSLVGTQNGQALLNGELTSPMTLSSGNANSAVGDSAFNLTVTNLNLADWKPFLGGAISEGNIGLKLKLLSQQSGKQITLDVNSQLANLAPIGGDKKLTSASIVGNLTLQQSAANENKSLKGGLAFSNVVIQDPTGTIPSTPLETKVQVDATLEKDTPLKKQALDLRQLQVTLTPTTRAQNQLLLQGRVDFSNTNAVQGNLKLTAEALDLTTYYDLFAGQKAPETTPAEGTPKSAPAAKPGAAKPEEEPAPKQLPFKNFLTEVSIGRFYLREVEITNWVTTLNLDGGHVLTQPVQLTLNGAPVKASADIDLSVPGYRYAVEFSAVQIPFAPLVNSFAPDRKGQLGGTLSAQAKISGLGTTGVNLQKNLTGQFDVGTTNLNLAVVNIHSPLLKTLVNVIVTLPQLLKNPESAVTGLLGSVAGGLTGGGGGGFADDLSKSPIDVISARGSAGSGKVQLDEAVVRSAVFEADAHGEVALAPVLTNSTLQVPVVVKLSSGLAAKLNIPSNAGTNVSYVALPDFLTIKGTVGKPKADYNKSVLGKIALQSLSGGVPGSSKTGNLLQGILGGKPAATNAPGNTNASTATNQSPVENLLNQFLKPRKK